MTTKTKSPPKPKPAAPPGPLVCRPPTPEEAERLARDFPEFVRVVEWDEADDANTNEG